jgi:hypothetical protein
LRRLWRLKGGLEGEPAQTFARQLMRACLACGHASDYQDEHAEFLAQDWAHVPIPRDARLFKEFAAAGDLVARLLDPFADASAVVAKLVPDADELAVLTRKDGGTTIRTRDLHVTIPHFGGARGGWRPRPAEDPLALDADEGDRVGDLDIYDEVFFANVPESVWRYELGGYPMLKKWLAHKDARRRPGQPLSLAEKDAFRDIVRRLSALIALRPRLNALYGRAAAEGWSREELGM